jgi:hypothetical protein
MPANKAQMVVVVEFKGPFLTERLQVRGLEWSQRFVSFGLSATPTPAIYHIVPKIVA